MVIGRNPAALPDREGVGFVGQRLQRRPVDRGEQFGPARVVALHDAGVDVADEFADRDIEIGQAEETAIAQPGQDPPLGDQHRLLDLGLVARLVGPRRQDRHAVMVGELPVAAVQPRLVSIRVRDRCLQIVADRKLRRAAEKGEQIDVRADPVGDLLARPRLREDVVRRAHDRDEQLHRPNLARHWVDDVDRVAGKIDEDLFAGGVALAHARPQPALERSVVLAKPAVTEPVRMCGAVFLPQERHSYALAAHLLVDERPVGLRTSASGLGGRRRREQQALQRPVVQAGRQGPVQARQTSPLEIRVNRPIAEQQGTPDLALAQPASEPQTQNIADFPHRQSLCWHGPLAVERGPIGRWNCRRTLLPRPSTGLLMIPWNWRSRWRGIRAQLPVE